MQSLTNQQIETVLNGNLDENFWIFQLAQGSTDVKGKDNDFSFPFYEKGKELLIKYKPTLKSILCDKEQKNISTTIDEIILGNIRELVVYIYSMLTGEHNLVVGIAIPLTAIVIKYNLHKFCAE